MKRILALSAIILSIALARPAMAGTIYGTNAATDITATTATLNGFFQTSDDGENDLIFNYGLTSSNGETADPIYAGLNGSQYLYDVVLNGLTPDTTYFFQFTGGSDDSGRTTIYGNELSFTTAAAPPTAATPEPASLLLEGSGAILALFRGIRRRKLA
jgi:hypothetical protein